MCILFIYQNPDPSSGGYRLILIANRDEYFARPAKSAHYWEDNPNCLGGKDMEPGKEGGTWLAINVKNNRAGVILNLNGVPKCAQPKGRGFLIKEYLTTPESTITHAHNLHNFNQKTQSYNPYALIMVNLKSIDVHYLSSELDYPGPLKIKEKISGFGNSGFEKPYKKVLMGKERFEKIVNEASTSKQESLIEDLLQLLKQEERHLPDKELTKRSPEAFNELSSIFVYHNLAKYGTRTHSILLVDDLNRITFIEEDLKPDGSWKRQTFNTQSNN